MPAHKYSYVFLLYVAEKIHYSSESVVRNSELKKKNTITDFVSKTNVRRYFTFIFCVIFSTPGIVFSGQQNSWQAIIEVFN